MTSSVLKKASMLAELGHQVQLVTFQYRIDQPAHQEYLVENGLLSSKVKMVNFFEDMESLQSAESSLKLVSGNTGGILAEAELVQTKSDVENWYFNLHGDLLFTEQLKRDDYPRLYRRYYDLDSSLLRLEVREPDNILRHVYRYKAGETQQPTSESYISRTGGAYLSISYRQDGSVVRVVDHTKTKGQANPDLPDLATLQIRWFQDLVDRTSETTLLVDDPYSFLIVQPAMACAARSILTLHSNTFVRHNDPTSEINHENRHMLDQIDKFECVVASTNSQCDDLRTRYPDQKFVAIPQLVAVPPLEMFSTTEHDPNLLVYVGRLEGPKQLVELLEAIPPLFTAFPLLRFEIFGEGSLEAELKNKIEFLELDAHVNLMGRTNTPLKELARANLSVLATRFEGFGIAIAESMAVGTPVVSFDCRYGPSDMIDDEYSGRLVPAQDFDALVKALTDLLADQEMVEEMRPRAREKILDLCGVSDNMKAWNQVVGSDTGT